MVYAAHLVAIPLFAWTALGASRAYSSEWTLWHWVAAGCAVYSALVGFFFPRKLMRGVEGALRKNASDAKAIKQWQAAQLLKMSSAVAIAVCGWALQILVGSSVWHASCFYVPGLLLLLLWSPRMPATLSDSAANS
jgi:hypothetical protein